MKFYRYFDIERCHGVDLDLAEYELVKETRCGYWINRHKYRMKKDKWVSKTSKKRFAYPTKEQALENFIARKERQLQWLSYYRDRAKQALTIARGRSDGKRICF